MMGFGFMMIFSILKQKIISKPAKNILDFRTFSIEKSGLLQGRLKHIGKKDFKQLSRKIVQPEGDRQVFREVDFYDEM